MLPERYNQLLTAYVDGELSTRQRKAVSRLLHKSAEARLLRHEGPALVFNSHAELSARIDDPDLEVDENTVLILRNAGPVGAPGMPEWGNLPIPKKLLARGIRDMVRISDARMSGTHYGCCIVHAAPEAAIGGPLALVRTASDPTPSRFLRSRATSLPVTTPIDPVIVPGLATIASAPIDT